MRIALCNALYTTPEAPYTFGGAEVFVRQLAEALVVGGDEVIVLRAALEGGRRSETVNGVTVHFLPIRNLYPPFQDRKNPLMRMAWHAIDDRGHAPEGVAEILGAFRPEVFHSHTLNGLSTEVWEIARGLGIPVLHTMHDYYLTCPRCTRFKAGQSCTATCRTCDLLTRRRRQRTCHLSAVTGVSARTLEIHHHHHALSADIPAHVVRNVPNPAITLAAPPTPQTGLKVGYIGRFSEEKGVHLLVEAVGRLPAGAVELRLAGRVTPEEEARLRALAPNARLTFLGFVAPMGFYESVDLTVVPSLWEEPAALVVQDSLAAGRPVLGSRMGGTPESIEPGVTGWIVEPTVAALTDQLQQLIDAPSQVTQAYEALTTRSQSRRTFADLLEDYRRVYRSLSN